MDPKKEGWFLTYNYFQISLGGRTAKIPLAAVTEAEALKEARDKWREERAIDNNDGTSDKKNPELIFEKRISLDS